ncbi:Na+/H+ antiporter subunit A [Streptomyces sp. JJ66]|uniref:Na+/H+ antiporter subunit A n=1 Tax=Streptomyces sp. JJ66 TaxID=2803843 RepID=UPI001C58A916|nr:Na+/H+ antiporter subunit A [Streptomyces sp. JJ66]MBW1603963.1 Na+/H+ antiporter subunit A [Streptomyces sp. JJ66]
MAFPVGEDGKRVLSLVVLHLVGAALLPVAARRLGRAVWAVAALPPLVTLGWALARAGAVLDGRAVTESVAWAPALGLELAFRLDALSLLLTCVVAGIGVAVLAYGAWYYRAGHGRESGLLVAFAGVMLGLVLADHLFLLYVFWELTTVASFLLIAGRREGRVRRRAAEQALLTTVLGGLVMLLGLVMLGQAGGTYRISQLLADPPRGGLVPVALVLVLFGAFTKSAQFPLHAWLPAAMAAPTPVSAYLHAATMVKAGVYLVARLAPGFAEVAPWRPLVLVVGLYALVVGAWQALRESDLKRLLAYGTISELGLMIALLGTGTRTAALAGVLLLLAHALFKASLFMVVGVLDHQAGTRDVRELSGVGAALPVLCGVAVLAAASMAKLPPLLGFLAQDGALEAYLHSPVGGHFWALAAVFGGSVLTVTYTARAVWGAFARKPDAAGPTPVQRPAAGFVAPGAVLAVLGLAAGVAYGVPDAVGAAYAEVYPVASGKPYHAALWHGWTLALGLAALIVVLGLALHAARGTLTRVLGRLPRLPDAEEGYRRTLIALYTSAVAVTRGTQAGSLPLYLTVTLTTVVLLPTAGLLAALPPLDAVRAWWTPMEVPLAVAVLTAALAVTFLRHRLTAVLVTGAVGYGVAGLFALQGAPDLALTQFLVESLTLVVVVLVLRRMPPRFTPAGQARTGRWVRVSVAVAVGVFVAGFALVATQARQTSGPSTGYLRRVAETGGENVVNAILVDFRALDTLGEISVLLVTAIGVGSLVRFWPGEEEPAASSTPAAGAERPPRERGTRERGTRERGTRERGTRQRARPARGTPQTAARWDEPRERWLPGAGQRPGAERSVLLEVVTRLLFPSIVVLSLFLLFSGHYRPGGGFAGGLVAGQALILRYLVGGTADLGLAVPLAPGHLAGGGLALAGTSAALPLAFGAPPLTSALWEWHVPLLGTVKGSTSLFFDIGIYVLVVGVILKLLAATGTPLRASSGGAGETGEAGEAGEAGEGGTR